MKIIVCAGKKIKIRIYLDESGNGVGEVPDGQGIEKGCEIVGELLGEGAMDHSQSKDWQTEMKLSKEPTVQNAPPVQTKNPFGHLEL